jgi:20S proteasome alpha/beta subunit
MLSAGDALTPKEILRMANEKLVKQTSPSIGEITGIIKEEFSGLRKKIAEDTYLRPRGIGFDEFYDARIRSLPEWLSRMIDRNIETESLEVHLLVAGIDSDCARIYSIFDPGIAICHDSIGYTAVGSGAIHALSVINVSYDASLDEKDALKLIYKAKRSAEFAPGVGKTTDISIIDEKGIRDLTEAEIGALS